MDVENISVWVTLREEGRASIVELLRNRGVAESKLEETVSTILAIVDENLDTTVSGEGFSANVIGTGTVLIEP